MKAKRSLEPPGPESCDVKTKGYISVGLKYEEQEEAFHHQSADIIIEIYTR